MEIQQLLQQARSIWGDKKLTLNEILVCMGKTFGDLCRWQRANSKDAATHTELELKKELGNMIFSTIRWCDDLGYDPQDCIAEAIACQKDFPKS